MNKSTKIKIAVSIVMPYLAPIIWGYHYKGKKGGAIGFGITLVIFALFTAIAPTEEELAQKKAEKAQAALVQEAEMLGINVDELKAKKAQEIADAEAKAKAEEEKKRLAKIKEEKQIKECMDNGDKDACYAVHYFTPSKHHNLSFNCEKAVEEYLDQNSKFGWEWDDGMFESKFDSYRILNARTGEVTFFGSQVSVKNFSGQLQNKNLFQYSCSGNVNEKYEYANRPHVNFYRK
ncbi:hypothetical protein VSVS12_04047 [Vibrio scophthalmi]|uniref:hypothetical protein n=1 Tax=Vibrio scophthalmi TaxID=45658 RepID=UPI00080919A3|nr:hypothetical protein [Vibrio scophthalmi]ANS87747.1 hypothetical protein VSVS12_04047 [Vibrio scophthalmi]